MVMDSPSHLHAQLGHPSLAKMQQLIPNLSKLSSLSCESCLLENIVAIIFLVVSPNVLRPLLP